MVKNLFITFVFAISIVSSCYAVDVSAKSAILFEPETNTVLYSKNIDKQREIASTTKIMTAVVVLENVEVSDIVVVPERCVGVEGTSMYLEKGERLTVEELLYGLLLRSGNDAAETLAYYVGNGDINAFVDMMNKTAKRIGMKNSFFQNPHGLPADEHYSTAIDMAYLAKYAMKKPEFAEIVRTKEKRIGNRVISNHNKLLNIYDGANGIKTGFTKSAGRCLVSTASRKGMQLIAVTLSAPDDWNDHIRLFDYGFENYELFKSSPIKTPISSIPVIAGDLGNESITAISAGEISLLRKNSDKIQTEVYLPHFIYAPVFEGDVIGEVKYFLNGKFVDSLSLVSSKTVLEYNKNNFIDKFIKIFRGK